MNMCSHYYETVYNPLAPPSGEGIIFGSSPLRGEGWERVNLTPLPRRSS